MVKSTAKELSEKHYEELRKTLKDRFEKNMHRHKSLSWAKVEKRLSAEKLWSLEQMEKTGGEPDVIGFEKGEFIFCDCAEQSPKGRRSVCYDQEALHARKEHKPKNSAQKMAADMGVELLSEKQYRQLQEVENVDTKTSSWLQTPENIRKRGGAIFGDRRYDTVFIYHNGAESYYAARGFRSVLRV